MNKKRIVLYLLLGLIFLAVFNTVFFLVGGTDHPVSVWISYGFIHLAYFMMLLTPILTRKVDNPAVLAFPLATVSLIYFLVEFAAGLVFIFLKLDNYKIPLIVQLVIFAIYAVILIANLIANEHSADSEAGSKKEIGFVKDSASRVKALMDKFPDKKVNKEVEGLYDLLHSSSAKSDPSVATLEREITNGIEGLESAALAKDSALASEYIRQLTQRVEERNRRLGLLN